jgi:hypothetical protein
MKTVVSEADMIREYKLIGVDLAELRRALILGVASHLPQLSIKVDATQNTELILRTLLSGSTPYRYNAH